MKALSYDLIVAAFISGSLALAGCTAPPAGNTQTNTNNNQANTSAAVNANSSPASDVAPTVIAAQEPPSYSATIALKAEASGGERAGALPELVAEVARSDADRRISFRMPNGEQVVYLNRGNSRYIVLPGRRQYAELSPQAVGFDVPRLMMPSEIINYLGRQQGFRRVGEESLNGRTAVKYAGAAGTTRTGTQAGEVGSESFVYIDKETGLPLRVEGFSEAAQDVQGVRAVRVVLEMRDIRTNVERTLFEVPQGMEKVSEEQVRQQVGAVLNAATAIAGALLNNMNSTAAGASPSPAPR